MAVLANFKGAWLPRIPARIRLARPPGRVAVLAWALGIVALGGTAASSLFGQTYGASALVVTAPANAASTELAISDPRATALDPARFRRTAPPADGHPRVAVIVRGLGLSHKVTRAVIADLPADVTLALSAYGRELQQEADSARADGHEIFLDVPVEPPGFPANDAGPQALLSSLSAAENAERFDWALERFSGFAGVVFAPGSPAADNAGIVGPLVRDSKTRDLIWAAFEAKGFEGLHALTATAALVVAPASTDADVDAALERLETIARRDGTALAIISPTPTAITRLKVWAANLEQEGIVLVPASAVATAPAS